MSAVRLLPRLEHKLRDAYLDFRLSREAMNCSPQTMQFYRFTAGRFVAWLEAEGITNPADLRSQHVRAYLSALRADGLKDTTLHANARAVKTLTRFWHEEGYLSEPVKVDMPKLDQKRLPFLDADQLARVLDKGCADLRDKALILLMADTGLRRSEVIALDWEDVDIKSGLVIVRRGKGGKARSVVVGVKTRRILLRYRRSVPHDDHDPVFPSQRGGGRLTPMGLRSCMLRIGERAGVKLTPHMLRRTFATLSLAADMNPLHLQALLGHSSLEMVRRYVQMVETDLVRAHKEHGPVDRWLA
ncbi:MAG: tyrosine-type recombinase/integrase [Anaerolineales bacterium]